MSIEHPPHPVPYTSPKQQLVLEVYVSSLSTSRDFYQALGFKVDWIYPDIFTQLSWDGCLLFLKVKDGKQKKLPPNLETGDEQVTAVPGAGNVRIMVPCVDEVYERCRKLGFTIQQELGDRLLVLRDFIVLDPDGFGVRFGSYLEGRGRREQLEGRGATPKPE